VSFIIIYSQEKKALREERMKQDDKFMWAFVDGVKEKVPFYDSLNIT
jgi:hypothetical protein